VSPAGIATKSMSGRRRWLTRIPAQPSGHPVRVHLLAPDQARARLTQHEHLFLADVIRCQRSIELICFPLAIRHDCVEVSALPGVVRYCLPLIRSVQPETYFGLAASRNRDLVPPGGFGATLGWVHGFRPCDHVVVDASLRVIGDGGSSEQPREVAFVVAEQRLWTDTFRRRRAIQPVARQPWVINSDAFPI
jgi:hypothetical protein